MKLADLSISRFSLTGWLVVGGVLLVLSFSVPLSIAFLITTAAVYGILALSLNPLLGGAGLLSMCQLTFAAAGAATMGALSGRVPFFLSLLIAAACAAPVGLLLGAISLRLRGVSFAAASLGLAAAGEVVLSHSALPGFQSTAAVQPPAPIDSTRGYLIFVLVCLALLSVAVWWMRSVRIGRTWSMTRFSERAAASVGVSVPIAKLTAATVGAGIAGFGGALMVGQYGFITADSVAPINGLVLLVVAMVAGVGNVAGAWLAGLLFVVIPNLLTGLGLPGDIATILFGFAAIQVLATRGDGIAGQVRGLIDTKRRGRRATASAFTLADLVGRDEAMSGQLRGLEVADLTVDYGAVRALDSVSLAIPPSSVTGLIGPNGAGKSTLIDAITGFVSSYSGEVLLSASALEGTSARSRALAGVRRTFQQSRIPPDMTVAQYLAFCAGKRRAGLSWLTVGGALHTMQIGDMDMSTRRLVEVAGAFAAAPDVVLLDEPAAGLSESDSQALGQEIKALAAQLGVAVVLIEHDVEMVRSCCETAYVLDFGRVIAHGAPDTVLNESKVVTAYLGGALT